MTSKKKSKKGRPSVEDILAGKVSVTALELIRLIHKINPTRNGANKANTEELYAAKARLQSLLIDRFSDSLSVCADPDNPLIVSLDLKHFPENACHALLPELQPEARSWVQRQIDLYPESEFHPAQSTSVPKTKTDCTNGNSVVFTELTEYSSDQLLPMAKKALAEYDYEKCDACFALAFNKTNGTLPVAKVYFAFLMDNIAAYEKVIDLAGTLSSSSRKDKEIQAVISLAKARSGDIEEALNDLGKSTEERAMEVYIQTS